MLLPWSDLFCGPMRAGKYLDRIGVSALVLIKSNFDGQLLEVHSFTFSLWIGYGY